MQNYLTAVKVFKDREKESIVCDLLNQQSYLCSQNYDDQLKQAIMHVNCVGGRLFKFKPTV
jgi:hypothetical protein